MADWLRSTDYIKWLISHMTGKSPQWTKSSSLPENPNNARNFRNASAPALWLAKFTDWRWCCGTARHAWSVNCSLHDLVRIPDTRDTRGVLKQCFDVQVWASCGRAERILGHRSLGWRQEGACKAPHKPTSSNAKLWADIKWYVWHIF